MKSGMNGLLSTGARAASPPRFDFSPWTELPSVRSLEPGPVIGLPDGVGFFERLTAAALLVLTTPLILITAAAIKIESPRGPIFYRQERVGLERRRNSAPGPDPAGGVERRRRPGAGRTFLIVKFRTMVPDAERETGAVWASSRDPRVTRVGRVLRHLRIDEVPQLYNVMRGQMRLIGPRPERPYFVAQLSTGLPDYLRRLLVPPGITGLAQIEKAYDASLDDVRTKLKYDLYYVKHRCGLLDLKIILKTLDVMIRGRGAH